MKINRLLVAACLVLGALLLPSLRAASAPVAEPAFDAWVETVTTEEMRSDPTGATVVQYFTGVEQDAADRSLTPNTRAYRAARIAVARQRLQELARFDAAPLSPAQRISARILAWEFNETVRSEPFADHTFVFHQFRGLHVRLVNFLSQAHPIRNRRDIENYLARLELVAGQMDEGVAQARVAGDRGFLMPDFVTKAALGQFDRFLGDPPAKNVLVTSLDERAAKLADLSAADRAAFVAAAEKIVTTSVLPAFQRARALLQEQLPRTNDHAGQCWLPNGEAAYAYFLSHYTTTNLTPKEVHAIGLGEVTRIEARMDVLFKQLGYPDGSIKDRMKQLEARLQPPAEPDPRPALLARYEEILADAVQRAQLLFDLQPKSPCVVKREPPFTEKTAAAHYNPPARDGTRPGTFWCPLPGPSFRLVGMKTLVYHEAIPGHHFQIALMQEMTDLPRFRQDRIFGGNSAHSEGWALYAENLAAESGWYDGDPVGLLGQLNDELFRARRLVVDTGIHAMGWSRQQALDYGLPVDNPVAEVERYVVYPGQACSYKIGMLKIVELRTRAQQKMGAQFSLKEFHNVVLRTGSVPLSVLEQVIDDWIASAPTTPGKF